MVYSLGYKPAGSSYPNAELVEGPRELVVEDQTADGGIHVNVEPGLSGRRIKPESVARVIRRFGRRRLLDFEGQFVATVNDRFRRLIEEIEPGIHQFEPVRYIGRDDELLEERWFWQVCNRLDTVDRERSNGEIRRVTYGPRKGVPMRVVFNLEAIGRAKFWCDKHYTPGRLITDEVHERLIAERVTGLQYHRYEQA